MHRAKVNLPEHYLFTTEVPVRITDINYGGHLANDAILGIIHEARVQFLNNMDYTEKDIEGLGIIMSDSVIVYKSEGFHGDPLRIQMGVKDFTQYGCDIYYKLSNADTGKEIARAKTGIVFFDDARRKMVKLPGKFKTKIERLMADSDL